MKHHNNKFIENWKNTIQCLDCIEGMQILPDKSFDLVIADPPYGISRDLNCEDERLGTTAKLSFNFGKWDKFDMKWFGEAIKKTKGWLVTFCAKKDIGKYWDALEKNGFIAIDSAVWLKPDPLPLNAKSRFLNAWEALVIGKRPGAYFGSNYSHNVFKYQAPKRKNRIHPTQKPLELIKEIIKLTTKQGDLVLDPFIGSGTTAIACRQLGRDFIGFEIDKDYFIKANRRIKESSSDNKLHSFNSSNTN